MDAMFILFLCNASVTICCVSPLVNTSGFVEAKLSVLFPGSVFITSFLSFVLPNIFYSCFFLDSLLFVFCAVCPGFACSVYVYVYLLFFFSYFVFCVLCACLCLFSRFLGGVFVLFALFYKVAFVGFLGLALDVVSVLFFAILS